MNLIDKVEASQIKKDLPSFRVGDTLKVYFRVKEGEKTRTQLFEGICTRKRGRGLSATCTLTMSAARATSSGVSFLSTPNSAAFSSVRLRLHATTGMPNAFARGIIS